MARDWVLDTSVAVTDLLGCLRYNGRQYKSARGSILVVTFRISDPRDFPTRPCRNDIIHSLSIKRILQVRATISILVHTYVNLPSNLPSPSQCLLVSVPHAFVRDVTLPPQKPKRKRSKTRDCAILVKSCEMNSR
jgi:hypothetical protein